jgi:hypothetical protein
MLVAGAAVVAVLATRRCRPLVVVVPHHGVHPTVDGLEERDEERPAVQPPRRWATALPRRRVTTPPHDPNAQLALLLITTNCIESSCCHHNKINYIST